MKNLFVLIVLGFFVLSSFVSALEIGDGTPIEPRGDYMYKRGHLVWAINNWEGDVNSLLVELKDSCEQGFFTSKEGGGFTFREYTSSWSGKTYIYCSSWVKTSTGRKSYGINWRFSIDSEDNDKISFIRGGRNVYEGRNAYSYFRYGKPYFELP